MKNVMPILFVILMSTTSTAQVMKPRHIPNPNIDFVGFATLTSQLEPLRETYRISEAEFIDMSKDKDTIVLDTRSAAKYAELHIEGAVHLNFSDITSDTLAAVIPSPTTRILIYCNNNFENAPEPFPLKMAVAALNVPTFVTLYAYGYQNLYELGPAVDLATSNIKFAGTAIPE
ncbi:MAG: rhodanese-like domain-containing protein [Woeseiaceae bacterium]